MRPVVRVVRDAGKVQGHEARKERRKIMSAKFDAIDAMAEVKK